jgi:hypothetical protein
MHKYTYITVFSIYVMFTPICPYTPDQHTRNSNNGLYMQPHKHTADARYYNVAQTVLYHSATTK